MTDHVRCFEAMDERCRRYFSKLYVIPANLFLVGVLALFQTCWLFHGLVEGMLDCLFPLRQIKAKLKSTPFP